MMSRRSLITSGAVAAGALGLPRSAASAAAQAAVPPSIAALTSMRTGVTPITRDERRGRIEKARRLMAEHKIDALMLTGGTSLVYFSGIQWGLSERLFALVVPKAGEPFVVCPAFEEERAREQFATSPVHAARPTCGPGKSTRARTSGSRRGSRTAASAPASWASKKRCGSCSSTAWRRRRRP